MSNELIETEEKEVATMQAALLKVVQNPDIDPDRLEKFLNLQIKMEERQAERDFNNAMAKFQEECPVIPETGVVKNKDGSVRYTHGELDEMIFIVKPILTKNGLSYSFNTAPSGEEGKTDLITTVKHKNGHSEKHIYTFNSLDDGGSMNTSQRRKSALTYAKRAGLENALGLVTTGIDDDARRAVDTPASTDQIETIKKLMETTNTAEKRLFSHLKIQSFNDLDAYQAKKAISALKQKRTRNVPNDGL